jgi:tartrate-resistant acid phosphatase type 5
VCNPFSHPFFPPLLSGATPSVRAGLVFSSLFCGVATAVLVFAAVAAALGLLSADPSTVTFFVVGDWGREGSANQTAVAALMGATAATLRPSFVVAAGDNFYPNGLNSTSDPLFKRSFTEVYTQPGLQVPWFAVLGNRKLGDVAVCFNFFLFSQFLGFSCR